jgi:hypothetical protein
MLQSLRSKIVLSRLVLQWSFDNVKQFDVSIAVTLTFDDE